MNRTREKIALVILCLLLVLGGIALMSYIIAGHSLNVTATQIDDAMGDMEGYSVIVFEGTIDPDERREALSASDAKEEESAEGEATVGEDGVTEVTVDSSDDLEATEDVAAEEAADLSASEEESTAADGADSASSSVSSPLNDITASTSESISLDEVRENYEDKGASVFTIDLGDFVRYRDGLILKQGDKRIGVFSVDRVTTSAAVEEMVAYFQLNSVEIVVAIAPLAGFLGTTEGIDIVVTTNNVAGSTMGGLVDSSYVVQAPLRNTVGVVLISPGNVVSSKVISEL